MEETVGKYELSDVPRSLFAVDVQLLPCQGKSKLMTVLENLPDKIEVHDIKHAKAVIPKRVALVAAMARG